MDEPDPVRIVPGRVGLLELPDQQAHLGLGLAQRDSRLQSADRAQPVVVAIVALLFREGERAPGVHAAPHERILGARRHDADDRGGPSVVADDTTHDPRIGRVAPRPEPMAQHGDVAMAGAVFLRREDAAERGRYAEEGKEFRRGHDAKGAVGRLAGLGQVEGRPREYRHLREDTVLRLIVEEVGRGVGPALRLRRRAEHAHQPILFGIRQAAEEGRIDDAEHRCVDPDAEGEGDNGDGREAGSPAEGPEPVAHIPPESLHGVRPPSDLQVMQAICHGAVAPSPRPAGG